MPVLVRRNNTVTAIEAGDFAELSYPLARFYRRVGTGDSFEELGLVAQLGDPFPEEGSRLWEQYVRDFPDFIAVLAAGAGLSVKQGLPRGVRFIFADVSGRQ